MLSELAKSFHFAITLIKEYWDEIENKLKNSMNNEWSWPCLLVESSEFSFIFGSIYVFLSL